MVSKSQTHSDDPYLYLEDVEKPENIEWVKEQNKVSLDYLTKVDGYQERYDQAYEVLTSKDKLAGPSIEGDFVYNYWQDDAHPRGIWRRMPINNYIDGQKKWEVLLDIDKLSANDNVKWVFKGASISSMEPDLCLLHLSPGGSDAVIIKEFNIATKSFVKDGFMVNEAKTNIQWLDKDHVYIATDFGANSLTKSGYPRILKKWKRGQAIEDAQIMFEADTTDVLVAPDYVKDNDGTEYHFIRKYVDFQTIELYYIQNNETIRLELPKNFEYQVFSKQFIINVLSDWKVGTKTIEKGYVVSIPFEDLLARKYVFANLFTPTPTQSVEYMYYLSQLPASKSCFILPVLDNVTSSLYEYRFVNGEWSKQKVEIPQNGSVQIASTSTDYENYFLTYESFTHPSSLLVAGDEFAKPKEIAALPSYFDASGLVVEQKAAISKDGTRIPYFILHQKDIALDGSNPTIMIGYGGYQISYTPFYSAIAGRLWLSNGGVYVVTNIRGGGEFGPQWHLSAIKENKQKSYDDFIAIAEDLIDKKFTSAQHLGIWGGSNGGLLVGAVMVQRPDLFGAVACLVPLLDMKRYHMLLAGNSWMAEYGDPDKPKEWEYISKYSPYQNVQKGKYPAVLFMTSTRDDRVHPGHARKMHARMLEQEHESYLFENIEGGHAGSSTPDQRAMQYALYYSFFVDKLF